MAIDWANDKVKALTIGAGILFVIFLIGYCNNADNPFASEPSTDYMYNRCERYSHYIHKSENGLLRTLENAKVVNVSYANKPTNTILAGCSGKIVIEQVRLDSNGNFSHYKEIGSIKVNYTLELTPEGKLLYNPRRGNPILPNWDVLTISQIGTIEQMLWPLWTLEMESTLQNISAQWIGCDNKKPQGSFYNCQ